MSQSGVAHARFGASGVGCLQVDVVQQSEARSARVVAFRLARVQIAISPYLLPSFFLSSSFEVQLSDA